MDKDFRACSACTSTCFKEHADGTQQAPPNYSRPPCFLLTSLEVSHNWTPIPREFVEAHGETLRGSARILGSNGKEWSVEIGGPGKLLGFKGGWKTFVASTSVKRGDQMLFSLISKGCFSVHVFNKLGVEVVPPLPVETKYTTTPASGKRKRLEVKPEPVSEDESDSDGDGDSSDSDKSEYEASKSDAESPSESESEVQPTVVDEETISKPRKKVKRKLTKSSTTTKPSHEKKVRANLSKEGIYIEPGSCTTTYESRRRKVTTAELERTIERGRALKTEFPSIPVVMMPSHVYRGFWLTIPGRFSKEFMPQEKMEVKLRDQHDYEWVATWIRSDKHTGLSGGWAAFSKDHCLEEGDVCVFEVIDSKKWIISVHIFRVVEVDLKPGATGGWEKTYNIVHGALMHLSASAKKKKSRKSAPVLSRSSAKKSHTVKRRRRRASAPDESEGSENDDSDVEGEEEEEEDDDEDSDEDDLPLTTLYKEKASSDVTSEEVDVKPKIISMGPIPKIAKANAKPEPARLMKVKQEPGLAVDGKQEPGIAVKVKQEPGLVPPVTRAMKRSESGGGGGVHSEDVKPSAEELRASLSQASCVTAATSADGKKWLPVVRLMGKRPGDFLVNLGPRVICNAATCSASEDGNGNWWVPRTQFAPDRASCYIE